MCQKNCCKADFVFSWFAFLRSHGNLRHCNNLPHRHELLLLHRSLSAGKPSWPSQKSIPPPMHPLPVEYENKIFLPVPKNWCYPDLFRGRPSWLFQKMSVCRIRQVSLPVPNKCCSVDDVELAVLPCPHWNFRSCRIQRVSLPVKNNFAPADHVELAGLPEPHRNFLPTIKSSLPAPITAVPRIMLSWLIFLVNMKITVLVDNEKVTLPVPYNCFSTDHVELADLPGQHEDYRSSWQQKSYATSPDYCCSTDNVELADLPGQHENYRSSWQRKSYATCPEYLLLHRSYWAGWSSWSTRKLPFQSTTKSFSTCLE